MAESKRAAPKREAKPPDPVADLRSFAEGQRVDALAVERYREESPDVGACLRLCRSEDPKTAKTGRLRAAAIVAAHDG